MFPYQTDLILSNEPQYSKNRIRLLVLGSQRVGKTSLIRRLVDNAFLEDAEKTEKFEKTRLHTMARAVDGVTYRVELQEADSSLLNPNLQSSEENTVPTVHDRIDWLDTHAILFVYDVTSEESYEAMKQQLPLLQKRASPDCDICIVGTKADLKNERQVHFSMAEKDAEKRDLSLLEVSSLDRKNIDVLLDEIMNYIIERREAQEEFLKEQSEEHVVYDSEPEEIYRDPIQPPDANEVAPPTIFCFWPFRR